MTDKNEPTKPEQKTARRETRGHRVRIERPDGSRFWHHESTTDADTAMRLARGRGLGTIVSDEAEPVDKDGKAIDK